MNPADAKKGEDAQGLAVQALAFIAADPQLLPRFLALTGIEPAGIRAAAREPGFMAGVLHFILAHEPTLLAFAASAEIRPAAVGDALRALPEGDERHDRSV